jgi:hypothetical protein
VGDRVSHENECMTIIWRSMHGGTQMGETSTHGMRAYAKHNNASMSVVFLTIVHVCTTMERASVLGCVSIEVTREHGCTPVFPIVMHDCTNVG